MSTDAIPAVKPSAATMLVDLAAEKAELWNAENEPHATIQIGDRRENWRVKSKPFKRWLARLFYEAEGRVPGSQALQDALLGIEAKACFDGACHPIATRVAYHGGAVYLDLGDPEWNAVEITANIWTITKAPPVRFIRSSSMEALPTPVRVPASVFGKLRSLLNVRAEDWPLVMGVLVGTLAPRGPYPILALFGEQGSGKSLASRMIRRVVDPNQSLLRCAPKEPRDLLIAARNGLVVCLDNLSNIPIWLSDALCRLSTGGGFSTRALYSDGDEIVFDAMRPAVINGIEDIANRSDLLDRCVLLELPTIDSRSRLRESTIWAEFDQLHAGVLGALCTAVSTALRRTNEVRLESQPRLADFAQWVVAAEPALGIEPGSFLAAYEGNRGRAHYSAVEASAVGSAVVRMLGDAGDFLGSSRELLAVLSQPFGDRMPHEWPKTPRQLSGALKRLAPNLRAIGVLYDAEAGRDQHRGNLLAIRKGPDFCFMEFICFIDPPENKGPMNQMNQMNHENPTQSWAPQWVDDDGEAT